MSRHQLESPESEYDQAKEFILDKLVHRKVSGPDPSVTLSSILDDLIVHFGFSEQAAQSVLIRVCSEFVAHMRPQQIREICRDLSEDLQSLFSC